MKRYFRRRRWFPHSSLGETKVKKLEKIKLLVSLILPFSVGLFTIVTTLQNRRIARDERLQEQRRSDDDQQETIFVNYINDIARYRDRNADSLYDNDKLIYIQAKTLTALRKLDDVRKKLIFLFLRDSSLLPQSNFPLLSGADFNRIELHREDCQFMNTNFSRVQFRQVSFTECVFINVVFVEANFNQAHLSRSTFFNASFIRCNLIDVDFQNNVISTSIFTGSKMVSTNFRGTVFSNVSFSNVDLTDGKLSLTKDDIVSFNSSLFPNGTFSVTEPIYVLVDICKSFAEMIFSPEGTVLLGNCTLIVTVPNSVISASASVPFGERSMLIDSNQAEFLFQFRRNDSTARASAVLYLFGLGNGAHTQYRIDCPVNAGLICHMQLRLPEHIEMAALQIFLDEKDIEIDQISYTLRQIPIDPSG